MANDDTTMERGAGEPRPLPVGGPTVTPSVVIAHHADLSRIGGRVAVPPAHGLVIGRGRPAFAAPDGPARPLDDPYLSREQLRIEWTRGQFRVSRLGRLLVEPDGLVPPGTFVAIGDRVLLWLGPARVEPKRRSRLGLVGESAAMWTLRDQIESVAADDALALITGETGAGKERVARAVHDASARRRRPFVPVNCAALPHSTFEAELFGSVGGAFTQVQARPGLIRSAAGGTVFLDEIGELPLELQAKLLRGLETGEVRPVGGQPQITEVRFVAATNQSLEALRRRGRLRDDLYYRLNVLEIGVPALKDHPEDIPLLFAHFAIQGDLARMSVSPDVEDLPIPVPFARDLARRPWPGNVRQLANYVRAVTAASRGRSRIAEPPGARAEPTTSESMTAETLVAALASHDFSRAQTARALGVSRSTIYDWLAQFGFDASPDPEALRGALEAHDGDVRRAAHSLLMSVRAFRRLASKRES